MGRAVEWGGTTFSTIEAVATIPAKPFGKCERNTSEPPAEGAGAGGTRLGGIRLGGTRTLPALTSRTLSIRAPGLAPITRAVASILKLWHLASFDAPTVAVLWGAAFAWAAHVRMAIWPLALLGLVVWALYVGDRLLDARAGYRDPLRHELRERHCFHWNHRRILAPLAGMAVLAAAIIVRWRVPAIALPQDSAVAVATLAYFSGVHGRVRLPKSAARAMAVFGSRECVVGMLFATGCVLPAWSINPVWNSALSPARLLFLPALYYAALAWLNVRAITHWEAPDYKRKNLPLGRIALCVAVTGLVLASWLAAQEPRAAALVTAGAASAILISWLDWKRARLQNLTLRVAVDMVLLTPLLLLVIR
jgi:hypothetical protein